MLNKHFCAPLRMHGYIKPGSRGRALQREKAGRRIAYLLAALRAGRSIKATHVPASGEIFYKGL